MSVKGRLLNITFKLFLDILEAALTQLKIIVFYLQLNTKAHPTTGVNVHYNNMSLLKRYLASTELD